MCIHGNMITNKIVQTRHKALYLHARRKMNRQQYHNSADDVDLFFNHIT